MGRAEIKPRRRAAALFVAAAVIGAPAAALRVLCMARACRAQAETTSKTPFCSLPEELRRLIQGGFYEGRSPDALAVTGPRLVSGGNAFDPSRSAPVWPSLAAPRGGTVPLVFFGTGVNEAAKVPSDAGLRDVAGTIATIMGVPRPHANVRSGEAFGGIASGETPRLVLEVVWKGIGNETLRRRPHAWPRLRRLMKVGAGTNAAAVGSLPLDPAAALATIGTGGLPSEHGITGSIFRSDAPRYGRTSRHQATATVAPAWSGPEFETVIATFADDLDHALKSRPVIGLVGTDRTEVGLIGAGWYPDADRDRVMLLAGDAPVEDQIDEARALFERAEFGRDSTPDLLGIVMSGSVGDLDRALPRLTRLAKTASGGSAAIVVTGTGAPTTRAGAVDAGFAGNELERSLPGSRSILDAVVPGGVYLDQDALTRLRLSDEVVSRRLAALRTPDGRRLIADAFPDTAVAFGRYC